MRSTGAIALLLLTRSVPAAAASIPDRRPGGQLVAEVSSLYSRRRMDTWADQPRPAPVPLGRRLFFLNRTDGVWQPATGGVKLLIGGEVSCYGQFVSNPGGLSLARMA